MDSPQPPALPPELRRVVSKEEINALPIGRYEGRVVLVSTPAELDAALADLAAERAVGFDTETRPAFRPGERYLPSLVQFATANAVYLFQLSRMDFAASLARVLGASTPLKVGVSVADDLKSLREVFPFEPQGVLDLGEVARRAGLKQTGVRNLAGLFLGFRIPKGVKTSNWSAKTLTAQQVGYAATDAWACRELWLKFEELGLFSAPSPATASRPAP